MKIRTRKRLLGIALVSAIVSLSIYMLSTQSAVPEDVTVSDEVENQDTTPNTDVLLDTITRAEVRGFYRSEERGGSEMFGGTTFICDQLVVTAGGEIFGKEYREMIEQGNAVQQVDEADRLVLNLDFSQIDSDVQNSIQASTPNEPVLVELEKIPQGLGRGVSPCHSFVAVSTSDNL